MVGVLPRRRHRDWRESTMTVTQNVLVAEADRYRAMVDRDVDALRSMCHPKLRYVHSLGGVDTLDSWLAKISGGEFRYDRIEHPVESVDMRGDMAIVHGRILTYGEVDGRHVTVSGITTSVLVREAEQWLLLSFQSTRTA